MKLVKYILYLSCILFLASCQKDEIQKPKSTEITEDLDQLIEGGFTGVNRSGFQFVFNDSTFSFYHLDPSITTEIRFNSTFVRRMTMKHNGGDGGINGILNYLYDMRIYYTTGDSFDITAYGEYYKFKNAATYVPTPAQSLPWPFIKYSLTRQTSSISYRDLHCNRTKNKHLYKVLNTNPNGTFTMTSEYIQSINCNSNVYRLKHIRR